MEGAVWTTCSDSDDAEGEAADDCMGSAFTVNLSEGNGTPDIGPRDVKQLKRIQAEGQKPDTRGDPGKSAKELKVDSSIAKNVVSPILNPGRSEVPRKKSNLIQAGQGLASQLAKKSELPQARQTPSASTQSGESSTAPSNSQWNPKGNQAFNSAKSKGASSLSSQPVNPQTVHTGVVANYCTECKITFRSAARLNRHRHKAHSTEQSFRCPECNKPFPNPGAVFQHRIVMHNVKNTYQCSVCNLVVKNASCLNQHHRINHGFSNCSECSEEFTTLALLKQHQWDAHNIGKLLTCEICGETFINFTKFQKHRKAHGYQCTMCGQTFKRPNLLVKHRKTHG